VLPENKVFFIERLWLSNAYDANPPPKPLALLSAIVVLRRVRFVVFLIAPPLSPAWLFESVELAIITFPVFVMIAPPLQ
jgi:hypothetical protein